MYQEKVIKGKTYFRVHTGHEWKEVSNENLTSKIKLQKELLDHYEELIENLNKQIKEL